MEYKTVKINDLNIAVYEKGQGEKTILFIHGNSLNATTFSQQFNSSLADNYKLVAIDLPGHGKSDFSKNPDKDYSLEGYSKIISQLITKLDLKNYYIVGHSLGGHIAIETCPLLDEELKGLVISGTPPASMPLEMEKAYLPNPILALCFKGDLNRNEAENFAKGCVLNSNIEDVVSSILITDPNARSYLAESIGLGKYKDEVKILKEIKIPFALCHGMNDTIVNVEYLSNINSPMLWQNKIHLYDNCGHCPQIEKPTIFNTLLSDFVS